MKSSAVTSLLFSTLCCFLLLQGSHAAASSQTPSELQLPKRQHPFLFATSNEIAAAKTKAGKYDWARRALKELISQGDEALSRPLDIPPEGGQWSHYDSCKRCGSRLTHKQGRHFCESCGAEYRGWPYDQLVYSKKHGQNMDDVQHLGLAYAFSGEEKYARRARQILVAYADTYSSYPLHDNWGRRGNRGARLQSQTLTEAGTVSPAIWGYDLVYNSPMFSKADHQHIENDFFRPVAKTLQRFDAGMSNWQSFHNAALAQIGLCLEDAELTSLALYGKSGLEYQLAKSVLDDGFWYEGSPAYHFFALRALRLTVEAALHAGLPIQHLERYKSLFDAPLDFCLPDLSFPAINDSSSPSLEGFTDLYEAAYARFHDPRYLTVLKLAPRSGVDALLFGEELPRQTGHAATQSHDFSSLGAAVLRQGPAKSELYVHLDYGPHGGGHGHFDKLAIMLFGFGVPLAPDPGALAYSVPLHGSWYRQTVAHNTLCVDEQSQQPATGRLEFFDSKPGLCVARAMCDTATSGVTLRRTLALTPEYLVDVYDAQSSSPHTYDWLYHNYGKLVPGIEAVNTSSPIAAAHGYQHITDVRKARSDASWQALFTGEKANVQLTMVGGEPTELFFGNGVASRPPKPCPVVIARRKASHTRFISLIEPTKAAAAPTSSTVSVVNQTQDAGGNDTLLLEICRGGQKDLLLLAGKAGVARTIAGETTTAPACLVRMPKGAGSQKVELWGALTRRPSDRSDGSDRSDLSD